MSSCYLKCRKNTGNINPEVARTINDKITTLSKCAICGIKKSRLKKQEASEILSNLGLKTPLIKIPLLGYKMIKILNKFLLAGGKFMPEMYLRKPRFTCSACGPFTKNKEFKNLKKQEIQAIFTKMNLIRHAFNMIWLMGILKI